jgi:ATP-dependent exoDNAse (exonuclease V) alpha subunit
MAIYHFGAKIIGRSSGRSPVAAAAYRSGEKLHNEYDGLTHNYAHRKGVIYTEIMLPDNAPRNFSDRENLWNAVEKSEKRKDAQTAREVVISIPIEFNRPEGVAVIRDYVAENFVKNGMCADIAIHDDDGNPHAHVMLTTRDVDESGFGAKNRTWNDRKLLENWRKDWADTANRHLQNKGFKARIDHRTLKEQGIDREPKKYMGLNYKHIQGREVAETAALKGKIEVDRAFKAELQTDKAEVKKIERYIKQLEKNKRDLTEIRREIEDLRKSRGFFRRKETTERIEMLERIQSNAIARIEREIEQIDRLNAEHERENRVSVRGNLALAREQNYEKTQGKTRIFHER